MLKVEASLFEEEADFFPRPQYRFRALQQGDFDYCLGRGIFFSSAE